MSTALSFKTQPPKLVSMPTSSYDEVNMDEMNALQSRYAWIAEPIIRASEAITLMPFFTWIEELSSAQQFSDCAQQLFYHSATFPKVMGLMLATTPHSENSMMPFYAKHAFGEADHHELLMMWMLKQGILRKRHDIEDVILTPETNACINMAYQLAIEQDREKWIVAVNCGIERCSNDFFKAIAPMMRKLGAGDTYFDLHVEADEFHSIMGLKYLQETPNSLTRRRQLIAKGLESVSLWAAMIHSWIGVSIHPQFSLDGRLLRT